MSARILDGRMVAAELRADVAALTSRSVIPRLAVVVVSGGGVKSAESDAYVHSLTHLGAKAGIDVIVDELGQASGRRGLDDDAVRAALERHGRDRGVHGIILQQPLPPTLSIRKIADAIPVEKDVDGANPVNQGRLAFATGALFVPATPAAVMLLLERSHKWPLRSREVTIIGRS